MRVAEARRCERTPVAALDTKTGVAQCVLHQVGDAVGDLLDPKARLSRLERQTVPRQGRRDDGKCVRRVAAEPCGVRQPRNQLQKLEDRAGPAMEQKKRTRVRSEER